MTIENIIKTINKLVSNNSSWRLDYDALEFYLDSSIDYINQFLKTDFTAFSSLPKGALSYTEIPDSYIRQVVVYYVASMYLEEEDETEEQYKLYRARADEALYKWQGQDYSSIMVEDNNYDYSLLAPYRNTLDNTTHFEEEKQSIISSTRNYYINSIKKFPTNGYSDLELQSKTLTELSKILEGLQQNA